MSLTNACGTNEIISINQLTKDYGRGRGVFDVNLSLQKGECLGLVGANGAGKTTLIRSIMGFIKPTNGKVTIYGMDAWADADKVKDFIGYVPGEIAFPDIGSGMVFIKSQAAFLGVAGLGYANELVRALQIDLTAELKKMSKGMKQKTALVAALMNDADILIMDEPSNGLDPLMRVSFINVISQERKKGKTILLSSHLYEEVEQLCDRAALLYNGRIEEIIHVNDIVNRPVTEYKIEFTHEYDYLAFKQMGYPIIRDQQAFFQVTVEIANTDVKKLLNSLSVLKVKFITENRHKVERHFKQTLSKYRKETNT